MSHYYNVLSFLARSGSSGTATAWGLDSYRHHGKQPWYRRNLNTLVWLFPLLHLIPMRKNSTGCSPHPLRWVWPGGVSQVSTSLQQWRRTCTTSICVIPTWKSSSLVSRRDAGGRLVPTPGRLTRLANLWTVLWLHCLSGSFVHHPHIQFDTVFAWWSSFHHEGKLYFFKQCCWVH